MPELLALIPALVFIGYCVKHKTGADNKNIPWVLGVAGVAFAAVWIFASQMPQTPFEALTAAFTAICQGLLAAAGAVFANQLYKSGR